MSSGFNTPRVRRRTVTLTHDKIIKEIASDPEVRIIRAAASADKLKATSQNRIAVHESGQIQDSKSHPLTSTTGPTVLVVNASQGMAQEITLELSRTLPGCSILFAPTLNLALWMLKRRSIDIILSSSVLPDGPLSRLHASLEMMSPPPELVIISDLTTSRSQLESHPGYRFVELRRVPTRATTSENQYSPKISELGADLRNDLNNPLQEIVAMAFVATTSQGLSPSAEEALSAIQRAATNMASVVNSLEEKIRRAVGRK